MCVFVLVVCIATVGGMGLPLATSLGRRSPARYTDAGSIVLGLTPSGGGCRLCVCACVLLNSLVSLLWQARSGSASPRHPQDARADSF